MKLPFIAHTITSCRKHWLSDNSLNKCDYHSILFFCLCFVSPRHGEVELFEADEENYGDDYAVESFVFRYTSDQAQGTQQVPRNTETVVLANTPYRHITIRNLVIVYPPAFVFFQVYEVVKEEHNFWWIIILIAMKLPFLSSVRPMISRHFVPCTTRKRSTCII